MLLILMWKIFLKNSSKSCFTRLNLKIEGTKLLVDMYETQTKQHHEDRVQIMEAVTSSYESLTKVETEKKTRIS